MKECQAFIFYGLEKLFSFLPPAKIAPVHLAGKIQQAVSCCTLIIIKLVVIVRLVFIHI